MSDVIREPNGARDADPSKEVHLWFGPQHPGVTGNMAVEAWVMGDTIQRGITHVGYLHRGFEKLMERRTYIQSFPIVCRICVPEPDTNEYLLTAGLEELSGLASEVTSVRWGSDRCPSGPSRSGTSSSTASRS